MNFSDITSFGFCVSEFEKKPLSYQEVMADTIEESQLTDDFVVNMVDGMEGAELTTIDYDHVKLNPVEMYTNLVPTGNQYDFTTLAPMNASSESFTVSASSPAPSESYTMSAASPAPSESYTVSTASPSYFENTESSLFAPFCASSPTSPASSFGSESPRSILCTSPSNTEESITLVVSPAEVFGDQQAPLKKKRGRKPKSENGPISRQRKTRKPKVYEIDHPFEDKELERKRLNAVNAKRHRDLQKQAKVGLEKQLQDVIAERDNLKLEVETLRTKESELTRQLEVFKNHLRSQHNSVVMLLQSTPGC